MITPAPATIAASESVSAARETAPVRWPLPLTAFETYMYCDDRPDYPMAFVIRVECSGDLNVEAFSQAATIAARRHPLLTARIIGTQLERLSWTPAADPTPWIDIGAIGTPLRYPEGRERIDLRRHGGLRIWVREGHERVEITFQFHHVSTDGVGAYQFINDLLEAYHLEVSGEARAGFLTFLEPARIENRNVFGVHGWRRVLRMPLEIWGLIAGMATFFGGRPSPIAAPHQPQLTDEDLSVVIPMPCVRLTPEESRALVQQAKASNATVNDWLMRDAFRAIAEWNVRHSARQRPGNVRLMFPMNLRTPEDERTPAANIVGMAFIERWMTLFRSPRFLLTSIKLETAFLKKFRLAISNSRLCAMFRLVPGWMARMAGGSQRCYATGVWSNVGVLYTRSPLPRQDGKIVSGGMVIETFASAPPVRHLSSISMTALTYSGAMSLVLAYDRRRLTAEDAEAFMALLGDRVRRTLAETA